MKKERVYIIAEIGINHNGLLDNCYRLIDASLNAGCDAVKFQFFRAAYLYPRSAGRLNWKGTKGAYSYDIYKGVKNFEMPGQWLDKLIAYCRKKGIDFLSSVYDTYGLGLLVKKGLKTIKLASFTLTNIPLIRECAKTRLPLIMSTGGATIGEVEEAVSTVFEFHKKLSLLHCSIKYPTPLRDCNLGVIRTLQLAFGDIMVGFSDHTSEISKAAIQSVYLGGKIIEKHITLDRKMLGPDHFFALEPAELRDMVRAVRQAEIDYINGDIKIDKTLFGNSARITYPHERYLRDFAFMRLFAGRDIRQGERIMPSDIIILRPGKKSAGLKPKYLSLFGDYKVTAKKDIKKEEPVTWEKILG